MSNQRTKRVRERARHSFARSLASVTGEDTLRCPLCLKPMSHTEEQGLTWDHVPPAVVGGRLEVPVCKPCNNRSGSTQESQYKMLQGLVDFNSRYPGHIPAVLRIDGSKIAQRVAWQMDERNVRVVGRNDVPRPGATTQATKYFEDMVSQDRWEEAQFRLESDSSLIPSPLLLSAATLKSSYLAIFWFLGYGAILSKAYDPIRALIRHPNRWLLQFVGVRPLPSSASKRVKLVYIPYKNTCGGWAVIMDGYDLKYLGGSRLRLKALLPSPADTDLTVFSRIIRELKSKPGASLSSVEVDLGAGSVREESGLIIQAEQSGEEFPAYDSQWGRTMSAEAANRP